MERQPRPARCRSIHRFGQRTTLLAGGVLVAAVALTVLIVLVTVAISLTALACCLRISGDSTSTP